MDDEREELLREKLEPHREDAKANHFLNLISQLESSSGRDLDHPPVSGGIQAGDRAIGQYALMPNTINELAQRSTNPELKPMIDMNEDALRKKLQNKDVEYDLARQLADKVLTDQPNEEMAAYSWNHGHNLKPQQIMERNPASDLYVQKFDLLKNKVKGNK